MANRESLISKGIAWGQRAKEEPAVPISHAAIVTRPVDFGIVSSDWPRVRLKSLYEYAEPKYLVAIYRANNITPRIKALMCVAAESRVGRRYPWWELALHLIDSKLFGGAFKARAFGSNSLEVCSEILGAVYQAYGYSFWVEGRGAQPDDIWRFVNDPERTYYDCVHPLGPLAPAAAKVVQFARGGGWPA